MNAPPLVLAYIGPETVIPITSVLAGVLGVMLAMGRTSLRIFAFALRPFRLLDKTEPAEQRDDAA